MSTATAQRLTAILHREEEVVMAECPEVGTVSQGDTADGGSDAFAQASGPRAVNGLISSTPNRLKSASFRVTTVS